MDVCVPIFNLDQTGLNAGRQQHRYYVSKALDSILSLHFNFITYVYDVIYILFDRSTSSGRDRKFVCDRFCGFLAEMAPNLKAVELQTSEIIKHLLEDEDEIVTVYALGRCSDVETDSPAGSDG